MNEIIKPNSVNFEELVRNSNTTLTLNSQSKMIDLLTEEFTQKELQWYIANLYIYLNYHPTDDYPINLENVYRMLGFANKGNAMKTIVSNFVENDDYKIIKFTNKLIDDCLLVRTEKQTNRGGHNREDVMLNIDTFKNLAMLVKTPEGTTIRKYYIKMENIHNKVVKIEIETTQKLLEESKNQTKLLELNLQDTQDKIVLMTRKTNIFVEGESVYIFHSTIIENDVVIDLYKAGRTKNANVRDAVHKTASYKGILLQITCVDSVLLERNIHFLLDKYRRVNRREWFTCSFDVIKNAIYYAKYVLENDIDFENFNLDNVKIPIKQNKNIQVIEKIEDKVTEDKVTVVTKPFFTHLKRIYPDIDNFDLFVSEHFEFNEKNFISHITLKNQYKIWSKTANHSQLKKLIEHMKTKYISFMYKANDLVSTSKLTLHFRGISLKQSLLNFEKPINEKLIIENYLYDNCQRASGFRITMKELFSDFELWFKSLDVTFTHLIKEKIKTYLDVKFIRLRSGDESNGKDNRSGGWLGFALKTNQIPEPIKKYKPKNAKVIFQKNLNNETIKEWNSVSELAFYLKKSNTVTSGIVNYHKPLIIDEIQYLFEFK